MRMPNEHALVADIGYGQALSEDPFPLPKPPICSSKPDGQPCTTNIRRFISSSLLILFSFLLIPEEARAVPLQTLNVPANGTKVQSTPLAAGNVYPVDVSGIYVFGNCNPMLCPQGAPDYLLKGDAAYLSDTNFTPGAGFINDKNPNVYLEINGARASFDPSDYNFVNHLYHTKLLGNGSPATFAIHDTIYTDNRGFLTAEIMTPSVSGVSPVGSSLFSWSAQAATVPEPGYLGLLGAGIIGLGLMRRRRSA